MQDLSYKLDSMPKLRDLSKIREKEAKELESKGK